MKVALCEWLVWRLFSKGGTLFFFAWCQPCSWAYSLSTSVEFSWCVQHADGMLINTFILCSPPCFVVLFQLMPDWWLKRKVRWCESTIRGGLGVHRVCIRQRPTEGRPPPGSPLCLGSSGDERKNICSAARHSILPRWVQLVIYLKQDSWGALEINLSLFFHSFSLFI